MSGPLTSLTLAFSPEAPPDQRTRRAAMKQLRTFLVEGDLSLVGVTQGDGGPMMLVEDARRTMPWLTNRERADLSAEAPTILVARKSFAENVWKTTGEVPFSPASKVAGSIGTPPGSEYVQLVGSFAVPEAPVPGRYVLTSVDPQTVQQFVHIMNRAGLSVDQQQKAPALIDVFRDPIIVLSGAMASVGSIVALLSWATASNARSVEIGIRRAFGATTPAIFWWIVRSQLLVVAISALVGAGIAIAIVRWAMLMPFGSIETDAALRALVVAPALSGLLVVASSAMASVISRRPRVV